MFRYVIFKSLDPEDPFCLNEDTPIEFLAEMDREGFTFSTAENAIVFTKEFAFLFKDYILTHFSDQLDVPLLVDTVGGFNE